ncbi:MAG: tetratricopeptide repeat protein, partial [Gemmatimonadota bacterium]
HATLEGQVMSEEVTEYDASAHVGEAASASEHEMIAARDAAHARMFEGTHQGTHDGTVDTCLPDAAQDVPDLQQPTADAAVETTAESSRASSTESSDATSGDSSSGDRAAPEFDLLDELLPPFMRHDGEETRAADVKSGEALADLLSHVAAHDDVAFDAFSDALLDTEPPGSALDVDALRALMLDRRLESGARSVMQDADGESLTSAFDETDVELPLLEVDDLLSVGSSDFIIPIDFDAVVADDLLGDPPTFGESSTPEFEPAPLFDVEPELETDAAPACEAIDPLRDATNDEWSDDVAPEVLIDGEWHDEHMGSLVSGEVSAIRPASSEAPPPPRARWDDLSAALLWPPDEEDATHDGTDAASGHDDANEASDANDDVGRLRETPANSSFVARMHTPRRTLSVGGVEAQLRRRLELEPGNLLLRRHLGEALLDQGDRAEGLQELDVAMRGFELLGDLNNARGVADIVLRVIPTSVRHHQKRVEYAVRSNDRVRLVEAYVELADSLFRSGEPDKARVVYSRVLELSPGHGRARFALGLLSDEERAAHAMTPPAPTVAAPPQPSPADMVSMFDRAIPRTPARDVSSISAELPIIADTLFTPEKHEDAPAPAAIAADTEGQTVDLQDVLAFERHQTSAADDQAATLEAPDDVSHDSGSESDRATSAALDAEGTLRALVEGDTSELECFASEVRAAVGDPTDDSAPGLDASSGDGADVVAVEAAIDGVLVPFPAPNLDDQIDEAFAAPPIVELDGRPLDHTGGVGFGHHDAAATPPTGAVAFATPFSSASLSVPTPVAGHGVSRTPHVGRPAVPTPGSVAATAQQGAPLEPPSVVPGADDEDFIDLGSWLRDDEPVRSTRMVTAEATPSGDEQADFDEMLRRFKLGVAANVEEEDYASHYDLGVAYKEMGLVDEAIAEFQKSLRGDTHRVRSYEALGQCFVEKGQLQVAATLLQRSVETTGADDQQLVGVLYLLGYASEVMARHADALRYYQRVFAVDIEFRDVAQRVAAMEQITQ